MKFGRLIPVAVVSSLLVLLRPGVLHAQSDHPGQAFPAEHVLSLMTSMKKPILIPVPGPTSSRAPTDAFCRRTYGYHCYSPQEMRNAYGVTSLLNAGYTGKGQTIVIIDAYGSPTIAEDLHGFDTAYGLPDPPSFKVLAPLRTVPFDPTNNDQYGWAGETTEDVEWAHSMAPDAGIVLLTSPVDVTEGVRGLPEFLFLEKYALKLHLGNIISQSWGVTENTLFTPAGRQLLDEFELFYQDAARQNVTVLAGAGDTGASNPMTNNTTYYKFPTVFFPASSPFVTAVGGTSLYLDASGNYQSETVWNDVFGTSGLGAGGGGVSQIFSEPRYQHLLPNSIQKTLQNHRGIPDVAFDADAKTGGFRYSRFLFFGYSLAYGTSLGSPCWAGIIADANQMAGHPLGFLNPKLYLLGATIGQSKFFHDITIGNNSFNGVPGYRATIGWDFTTGWGTPKHGLSSASGDLGKLVGELARQ
jgi:subtilase family serine protease